MGDDTTIKEPLDGKRINIHEPYEVNYWCKKFGCTKKELEEAVAAVGTSSKKVEEHLKNNK
ncbi:DUF3606 domain-containing protein [Clostridium scatologenes]|uniref:DUF3606 domain-containing protein n=1 Tax=Clostridium scatologenes TaxID=1548 RepID=A0A0E3GRE4_CLOSL|nr:DUF3606 domain-containing protein [Clostridium scatologenes]AKA70176.1 hypothetical protein CSCA_3051 [Clostridium scatologenes]